MKHKPWYKLDNTAKLFPTVMNRRYTTVFRISAVLNHHIKLQKLQNALEKTIHRYPSFNVHLKKGVFWYFWDTNTTIPVVQADNQYPCRIIPLQRPGQHPFRVMAYNNRISLEVSHAVTDGSGGLQFITTLLIEYFRQMDFPVQDSAECITVETAPQESELEDSYLKYYKKGIPHPESTSRGFHLPYKKATPGIFYVTSGTLSVKEILGVSRKMNVTLTEYLVAVLIQAFLEYLTVIPERLRKKIIAPIRISVPVNLRKLFPSNTVRNFFLAICPSIDPRLGEFSFDLLLKKVHHFLQTEIDEKYISRQITRNVEGELQLVNRLFPLFVKNLILPPYLRLYGEKPITCSLSNLGKVPFPASIQDQIDRFIFLPIPGNTSRLDVAVVSYNDNLVISFGRIIEGSIIERNFFRFLAKAGLHISIETNYGG